MGETTEIDGDIATYLQFVSNVSRSQQRAGWRYSSYEGLVLDLGQTFESAKWDYPEQELGACYENSVLALLELGNEHLFYCEGWACSPKLPLPIQHAWLVDDQGHAYDPTWETGGTYYGVPVKLSYVKRTILDTGYYGILVNDWRSDCVIVREGIPSRMIPKPYRR